jgi:periplasmic protein TonB
MTLIKMRVDPSRYAALLFVAALHVLLLYLLTLEPTREAIKQATAIMATLIIEQPKIDIKPNTLPKPLPIKSPSVAIKPITVPIPLPVIALTSDLAPTSDVAATTPTTQAQSATKPEASAATSTAQTVIPPKFDADYLDNPAPAYPALSRRLGEAGRVVLRVFVAPNGLASRIEIFTSSQFDRLDKAAVEAVRRWRFAPALLGDKPVSASVLVPVNFSLRG